VDTGTVLQMRDSSQVEYAVDPATGIHGYLAITQVPDHLLVPGSSCITMYERTHATPTL
jgi:hypothetical protein